MREENLMRTKQRETVRIEDLQVIERQAIRIQKDWQEQQLQQ